MAPPSYMTALLAVFVFCTARCWALSAPSSQHYMGGTNQLPFEFRAATVDDMDDMTTVYVEAFSAAPAWRYVHQFEDDYPGYTWHCYRDTLRDIFKGKLPGHDTTFRVIAVPDETAESGSRVVSIAVWEFNKTSQDDTPPHMAWPYRSDSWANCSAHLDLNMTRAEHFLRQGQEAEKKYLDDVYDRQDYLALLATHPKWDGNGFAAVHLEWGMALADETATPTTLYATTAGYPLYKSVGFKDVHNVTIDRLDGKGTIWFEVMVHMPENTEL